MSREVQLTILVIVIVFAATAADAATKRRADRQPRAAQPPTRIACTVLGCAPVPRGCGAVAGRTWDGMPTGHDVVVCPPGVAPFH